MKKIDLTKFIKNIKKNIKEHDYLDILLKTCLLFVVVCFIVLLCTYILSTKPLLTPKSNAQTTNIKPIKTNFKKNVYKCNNRKTCIRYIKHIFSPKQASHLIFIIDRENYSYKGNIPQCMPYSKCMGKPHTQIKWMVNYCKDRYGSIAKAKQFKETYGWY